MDRQPVSTDGEDDVQSVYKMSSRKSRFSTSLSRRPLSYVIVPSQQQIFNELVFHKQSDKISEESLISSGVIDFINKGLVLERLR